ncbi:DUF6335 family protein [Nodosilinea sp. E11]|uniref:DUF6335 family protein n=1 Tax=Nodosilinea sp. E11 TaxID=3037479 RepID=UPI0029350B8F|nr:DUF6335 family protein [Nodosilinea sp. E11]WOD40219.1 DUF6335 family protein [Nodosilinea sp. E11]
MSQKSTDAAEMAQAHAIDEAPPPPNEQVIHLPPARAAAEAARTGLEDDSAMVGATVPNHESMAAGGPTTAGDPDAMIEQAKVVGEEAIGGTTPTPDQNNVDDIAAAVGIDVKPEHPLAIKDEMDRRDRQRFELDPDSKDAAL